MHTSSPSAEALPKVAETALWTAILRARDAEARSPVCNDTYASRFADAPQTAVVRDLLALEKPSISIPVRHAFIDEVVRRERAALVLVLGLITLGLGWMLIGGIWPVVALIYIWNTLGSSRQATVGMSLMGIRLERLDGAPVDGMLAVVHSVLFWAFNAVLTPLILLVALFSDRKRLLQDLLLGTVVVRTDR